MGFTGFSIETDDRVVLREFVGFSVETAENFYVIVQNQQGFQLACTITISGTLSMDGVYNVTDGLLALRVEAASTITIDIQVAATGYTGQSRTVNHPGINGQLTETFVLTSTQGYAYKIEKRIYA